MEWFRKSTPFPYTIPRHIVEILDTATQRLHITLVQLLFHITLLSFVTLPLFFPSRSAYSLDANI